MAVRKDNIPIEIMQTKLLSFYNEAETLKTPYKTVREFSTAFSQHLLKETGIVRCTNRIMSIIWELKNEKKFPDPQYFQRRLKRSKKVKKPYITREIINPDEIKIDITPVKLSDLGKKLINTHSMQCKFIDDNNEFCTNDRDAHSHYCTEHHNRCYIKVTKPRKLLKFI